MHVIVTASPFRQEPVEDVLGHEPIETDDLAAGRFLFSPQVIEQYGHSPSRYGRTFVEAVVCPRTRLQHHHPLLLAPTLHGGVHPLHRHFVSGLEQVILVVSLFHQAVHHPFDDVLFFRGLRTELRGILAQDFLVDAGHDFPGTVTALYGTLVDVLVQCVLSAAKKRTIDDVHIGIVAGIAQRVAPELRPEVVGQAVHGVEVGKGTLVALRHGGQLFVEEEEGQRLAVLADEHVGTLHQLGTGNGLQIADGGERFVGQLGGLRGRFLQLHVGLLDAFLLEVLQLELSHELLHDGTGERLSASRFADYDELHQEGMQLNVVHILGSQTGAESTIAGNGGKDGGDSEGFGGGLPKHADCRREVRRHQRQTMISIIFAHDLVGVEIVFLKLVDL